MTATSKWELGYENCQRYHRNVMELISNRSKVSKSSSAYSNFTEQISSLLQGLQTEIGQLRSDLSNVSLTSGERQRREALVEAMSSKEKQLRVLFSQTTLTSAKQMEEERQRKLLLFEGGGVADLGQVEDWGSTPSTSRPPGGAVSFQPEAISASRDEILEEQDRGLDSLYHVIVRQKRLAENIESEVDVQNDIITDIGDGLDRTTQHLLDTTRNVTRVHQRDKGVCGYWIVIAILSVVIVIIVAIPGHH